jgi:hypothetical protein
VRGGLVLINDTACSAVQGYLALACEQSTTTLFPALIVDAGTGCSFAYVTLCAGSRVRVILLEPWVGRVVAVHAAYPTPAGATGEEMPLWRAASDESLRSIGAAAWNVRLQYCISAVQRWLADSASGQSPLKALFFAGGNSTLVDRRGGLRPLRQTCQYAAFR